MHLPTWVWIAALALISGCPGKSTTAAGPVAPAELAPVVIESTTSASQEEHVAHFPEGKFTASCAGVGNGTRYERVLEVSTRAISIYEEEDPERHDEVLLFDRGYYLREQAPTDDYTSMAMMLDDAIYFYWQYNDGTYMTHLICTVMGDLDYMAKRDGRNHNAELKAYHARRRVAEEAAKDEARVVRKEEWESALVERIARLKRVASIKVSARATDPDAEPKVTVTATLDDGSTMKVDTDDPAFSHAFDFNVRRLDSSMMVVVEASDNDSIRAEGEFGYSYDRERTFECRGEPGASGTEYDAAHGMYYHGRRGDHGPTITVEIAATGDTAADGEQVLFYTLACKGKREAFRTSAGTTVRVATYGGKGGYGVQLANGNGGNGGNGGDGGPIDVTIDPSVRRWNLVTVSQGGSGGAPSATNGATNVNAYGTRGDDGAEGNISETRAPVSPP